MTPFTEEVLIKRIKDCFWATGALLMQRPGHEMQMKGTAEGRR